MNDVQPIQPSAVAPASTRVLPDSVLAAATQAGFPAALGDPASFIRYSRLDAGNPNGRTVSHQVAGAGIGPYNALGRSIQDSVQAMNRAQSPNFQLNSIYGEFISFDMQAFAQLDRAGRQEATAALQRLNAALSGASVSTGPVPAGTVDGVDTARPTTAQTTTTPGTAAALTPPTSINARGEPLPDHPALAGTSPQWRAWLQRGDHRMQTVEALLGERPASFSAGLDQVQQRFGLGQDGRPANLEALGHAVQSELGGALASAGTPDGKIGRMTIGALADARDTFATTLATEGGADDIRAQLANRPNLLAALVPPATADATPAATTPAVTTPVEGTPDATTPAVATPATTTQAATTPVATTQTTTTPVATTPVEDAPVATTPAVTTPVTSTPVTTVTAPAVTTTDTALATPAGPPIPEDGRNYTTLAQLRREGGAAWTTERDAVIAEAAGRGWRMSEVTRAAAAADPALASELAGAYLEANSPSFWSFSPNTANRDFARTLFAQDPNVANTFSPDVLTRLSTSLATPMSGGHLTGAYVPAEDRAAVSAFETAFLRQAQSPEVLSQAAHYYHALANVDPTVVADAFARFGEDAQRTLGGRMVDYIMGTRAADLGAKEARLAAIIRAMRERGVEGPAVEEFTGTWRLGSNLTERVVTASK